MSSMVLPLRFRNISVLAISRSSPLSSSSRLVPFIFTMPSTLGMTIFMLVSMSAVAAISQSSIPLKDFSMGKMLSTAGKRVITLSAVISERVRSKPAFRSFLVRVE